MSSELGEQRVTAADVTSWVALVKAAYRAAKAWKPKGTRKDNTEPRT